MMLHHPNPYAGGELHRWFFYSPEARFEHREVKELAGVSHGTMQNWASRKLIMPVEQPEPMPPSGLLTSSVVGGTRRIYNGKLVAQIAIAARLIEQGVAATDGFITACAIMDRAFYDHKDFRVDNEPPFTLIDTAAFIAIAHIVSGNRPGSWSVTVSVGPPDRVLAHVHDEDNPRHASTLVKIGRIWVDLATRAYEMKHQAAEQLARGNNPDFDPWIQSQKRKRAAGGAGGA